MKRKGLPQKRERRVTAALRIALVALLLALQIGIIVQLAYLLQQYAALVYAGLEIAGLIAAVGIYNRRGDVMYQFTWIILILTVPVVGLILFLLWGYGSQRKRLRRTMPPSPGDPESIRLRDGINADKFARAVPAWARLMNSLRRRGFSVYPDTAAVYFSEGKAFLEDVLEKCARAERFIFLEYFILAEGQIWDRLYAILLDRVRAGVEVKLIFDDFGNLARFSGGAVEALRAAGVEVVVFNPVHRYVNRLYFNYRDHRKIACVDGCYAWTGGVNVADEYANLITRFGYWKDSGVRLEGMGAWGLTASFLDMWRFYSGEPHHERDYYRPGGAVRVEGWCQPFTDGPLDNKYHPAEDVYLQMIANARRFLYITTPYFIPDHETMHALCVAGDGGVDVRLMLPAIPDHRYTDLVASSYFGELMEHGVKVYRYTPGFLHQKCVMVDREAAMVGSVNMDYRSFQLHFECGVVLYGSAAVKSILEDMDDIVAKSHAVTREEWSHRKWYRRLMEPVLRIFAIWM